MKKENFMDKMKLFLLLLLMCIVSILLPLNHTTANEILTYFGPNEFYDVKFQVSERETNIVKHIRIIEICSIGDQRYLVTNLNTNIKATRGYILIDSIKSIFPSGKYKIDNFYSK